MYLDCRDRSRPVCTFKIIFKIHTFIWRSFMSEINELYQELIIDHSRNPRNFGKLENANHMKEGYNPLCGDKFTFYIFEKNGIIEAIKFEGSGCAISTASASLMTESLKGKTIDEADKLFKAFQRLVKG